MKQWIIAFSTCETNTFFFLICGSKNYPHLPHGRDFSLDPPPPLPVWKFQSSFIHLLKFWAFENLPPLGIFNPFCGGGVWIFSRTTQCKEDLHTEKCNLHTAGSCKTKAWKHPDLDSDLDEFSKLHCNGKLVINWLEHCTSTAEVRVGIQANMNFSGFLFATFYQSAS